MSHKEDDVKTIKEDTIAAISTPLGEGGIGIVRLSGPDSFSIGQGIFTPARAVDRIYPRNRFLYYGYIKNGVGETIDEVLVSFMKAPHTFTKEDIVEINGHGGSMAMRMILREVLEAGARLAEPGEFTRRAFLNGRIDLSQAESVLKLIRAHSERAVKIATGNLRGTLSHKVVDLKNRALVILAHLEATLDFPEESLEQEYCFPAKGELAILEKGLEYLMRGAEQGVMFQEGVATAIIGKPNVGKSSLLNALLGQQRALVHEVPGTTRDLLEGMLQLGGYTIRLVDTAGIHRTEDPVEKMGVDRSRLAAQQARLLLIVMDGSTRMTGEDERIIGLKQPDQKAVLIINKIDLETRETYHGLSRRFPDIPLVYTAAVRGEGISTLEKAIIRLLEREPSAEAIDPLLISVRHAKIITEALECVRKAGAMWEKGPLELVSMEIRTAWEKLGELTGETASGELLDHIFREFCIGK